MGLSKSNTGRIHSFTIPDGDVHEVHEVHHPSGTFTSPDGGIVGANRQVFTPLHSNASNQVRVNSTGIKYCVKEDISLNGFE